MWLDCNQQAFLALVRAGLWQEEVRLSTYGDIMFPELYRLADEQTVVGLIAAGIEYVVDLIVPQKESLAIAGHVLQIEQRSVAMDHFIKHLVDGMWRNGIYTLLIKGQGVAQCYERPLWRACGDIDFYLSESNYEDAKAFLTPLADKVDEENKKYKHQGMTIDSWVIELHGSLHSSLSGKINKGLDDVHSAVFYGGEVRSWDDNGVTVFLPSADNDIIIVFSHFITHFYIGGIGLRHICDWIRLLWTYRESIDVELLKKRLVLMGLMAEWRAFGSLAVEFLDMPKEAMPLYLKSKKNTRRANRILRIIFETGNMGHNRDNSYRNKHSLFTGKVIMLFRRLGEYVKLTRIFPFHAPKVFIAYVFDKL